MTEAMVEEICAAVLLIVVFAISIIIYCIDSK